MIDKLLLTCRTVEGGPVDSSNNNDQQSLSQSSQSSQQSSQQTIGQIHFCDIVGLSSCKEREFLLTNSITITSRTINWCDSCCIIALFIDFSICCR